MNDQAREQIETKIAFLEHANAELSDVVFRHQRLMDALLARMATLEARLQATHESEATPRTLDDERPPHY